MTEHVLAYDHSVVPQETYWDCGPASAQVVLNGRGVVLSESDLITRIGTTVNGTDYVGLIEKALNPLLPGANYTSVYFDGEGLPTPQQKEALWANIVSSINAGYGLVLNWDAPPSNHPVGVKGSQSPNYGGGEIMHYVPCMGYDDDPALRAVWIADPGFAPHGFWISFDQCATLIPPKGYMYSTAQSTAPVPATPAPPVSSQPQDTLWADVSEFQVPVDDSYPYRWIAIRSNDGTYQDAHFAQNYAWCVKAANEGRLDGFIVYFYWRPNWQDCVNTHINMVKAAGGPHPKMVAMIDVERGGNPSGDFSDSLNATDDALVNWLGDPKRVIAYGNTGDLNGMWSNRREDQLIVAAYGSNPAFPGKFAHQYTDGTGLGGGLPEGAPPFGSCDMNSADGLSPSQLAAVLGVAGAAAPTPPAGPPPPTGPPPLFPQPATPDEAVMQLWGAFFNGVSSASRYADPNGLVFPTKDLIRYIDGRSFDEEVERYALLGDPASVALVKTKAENGDSVAQLVYQRISAGKETQ